MRIGRVMVALATLLLAAGCTHVIEGTARPTPGMTPRPVTGRTVEQALLGERELSKLLAQSLKTDPEFPPRIGANGEVFDERVGASPYQCALAVGPMDKSSYQSADAQDGAREIWWANQTERDESVISVDEGVVALPMAAAADALFEKVSEQWKHCDGVNVDYRGDTHTLTGVGAADSVLSANARLRTDSSTIPEARVVGVRVNCLVEVEVSYFSSYGRTPDERKSEAIAIAHRMMDKVSDLS